MIISVRGTNGSGKSTVVRKVVAGMEHVCQISYPDARKRRPQGNIYKFGDWRRLFVPGHYLIPNGGIDTMKGLPLDSIYELILEHHGLGASVLYEGQNNEDGPGRLIRMHEAGIDARVIFLTTPLPHCVVRVRERGHGIPREKIESLHGKITRHAEKLRDAGVRVEHLSVDEAAGRIVEWLSE